MGFVGECYGFKPPHVTFGLATLRLAKLMLCLSMMSNFICVNLCDRLYPNGVWVIRLGTKKLTIEGRGNKTLPEFDQFYLPKAGIKKARTWDDLSHDLIDGAIGKFLEMIYREG